LGARRVRSGEKKGRRRSRRGAKRMGPRMDKKKNPVLYETAHVPNRGEHHQAVVKIQNGGSVLE